MEANYFDMEKASAVAKKIADIKAARHLEILTAMKEMRSIFTDEQFKNMKKMHMEMNEIKPGDRMMKKNNQFPSRIYWTETNYQIKEKVHESNKFYIHKVGGGGSAGA
jgi:hypothetical protein